MFTPEILLGEVAAVNGDGTYNISVYHRPYPFENVGVTDPRVTYKLGDSVRLALINNDTQMPIIIGLLGNTNNVLPLDTTAIPDQWVAYNATGYRNKAQKNLGNTQIIKLSTSTSTDTSTLGYPLFSTPTQKLLYNPLVHSLSKLSSSVPFVFYNNKICLVDYGTIRINEKPVTGFVLFGADYTTNNIKFVSQDILCADGYPIDICVFNNNIFTLMNSFNAHDNTYTMLMSCVSTADGSFPWLKNIGMSYESVATLLTLPVVGQGFLGLNKYNIALHNISKGDTQITFYNTNDGTKISDLFVAHNTVKPITTQSMHPPSYQCGFGPGFAYGWYEDGIVAAAKDTTDKVLKTIISTDSVAIVKDYAAYPTTVRANGSCTTTSPDGWVHVTPNLLPSASSINNGSIYGISCAAKTKADDKSGLLWYLPTNQTVELNPNYQYQQLPNGVIGGEPSFGCGSFVATDIAPLDVPLSRFYGDPQEVKGWHEFQRYNPQMVRDYEILCSNGQFIFVYERYLFREYKTMKAQTLKFRFAWFPLYTANDSSLGYVSNGIRGINGTPESGCSYYNWIFEGPGNALGLYIETPLSVVNCVIPDACIRDINVSGMTVTSLPKNNCIDLGVSHPGGGSYTGNINSPPLQIDMGGGFLTVVPDTNPSRWASASPSLIRAPATDFSTCIAIPQPLYTTTIGESLYDWYGVAFSIDEIIQMLTGQRPFSLYWFPPSAGVIPNDPDEYWGLYNQGVATLIEIKCSDSELSKLASAGFTPDKYGYYHVTLGTNGDNICLDNPQNQVYTLLDSSGGVQIPFYNFMPTLDVETDYGFVPTNALPGYVEVTVEADMTGPLTTVAAHDYIWCLDAKTGQPLYTTKDKEITGISNYAFSTGKILSTNWQNKSSGVPRCDTITHDVSLYNDFNKAINDFIPGSNYAKSDKVVYTRERLFGDNNQKATLSYLFGGEDSGYDPTSKIGQMYKSWPSVQLYCAAGPPDPQVSSEYPEFSQWNFYYQVFPSGNLYNYFPEVMVPYGPPPNEGNAYIPSFTDGNGGQLCVRGATGYADGNFTYVWYPMEIYTCFEPSTQRLYILSSQGECNITYYTSVPWSATIATAANEMYPPTATGQAFLLSEPDICLPNYGDPSLDPKGVFPNYDFACNEYYFVALGRTSSSLSQLPNREEGPPFTKGMPTIYSFNNVNLGGIAEQMALQQPTPVTTLQNRPNQNRDGCLCVWSVPTIDQWPVGWNNGLYQGGFNRLYDYDLITLISRDMYVLQPSDNITQQTPGQGDITISTVQAPLIYIAALHGCYAYVLINYVSADQINNPKYHNTNLNIISKVYSGGLTGFYTTTQIYEPNYTAIVRLDLSKPWLEIDGPIKDPYTNPPWYYNSFLHTELAVDQTGLGGTADSIDLNSVMVAKGKLFYTNTKGQMFSFG